MPCPLRDVMIYNYNKYYSKVLEIYVEVRK